ncbi:dehydrodolichyl diphosphate synthase 2-like [Panicum miliaceum]|uniref:Alkyl transferase n=1 Tax=Panicum miliaceum TaxID=4540 RepID=A0A3L6T316_PANMI|nr:dehydrodolichyl diphosphate synthase 2-like [Panicum miliaceum]
MADNDLPQALVQRGLRKELMPQHVAFVIDGSRRWAQARGLTTKDGYKAGCLALEKILELSGTWGIRAITVFGFSQENFRRPEEEVDSVMEMIERGIRDNMEVYAREGIRVHITGDPSRRPASLQEAIREVEEVTRNNSRFHMILATCYSGRWDIVQACRELATKVQDKLLNPEDIDEAMLTDHLSTNVLGELACPDLLIRSSGELRLSNFLLWQSAYTELYFTNALWPDFDEDEYIQALKDFQRRDRRFGQRKASQPSN